MAIDTVGKQGKKQDITAVYKLSLTRKYGIQESPYLVVLIRGCRRGSSVFIFLCQVNNINIQELDKIQVLKGLVPTAKENFLMGVKAVYLDISASHAPSSIMWLVWLYHFLYYLGADKIS